MDVSRAVHVSNLRLTLVLGALSALGPLSVDMYLPSFPSIGVSLNTGVAEVQLTLATYLAGLAVGQLLYGPLADRFGRRPPLLAGIALYTMAAIACAAAPSVWALATARFVQALGACAGMVVSRAVVRDRFDVRESARMYSSLLLVMGAAPVLAPLVGAQVLRIGGWRAIFLVLATFAAALLGAVALLLPETLPVAARRRHGVAEVLAALREAVTHRQFVRLSLAGGAIQAAMFAYIAGSPFLFIQLLHVPPARFGLFFGANALGLVAASQLNRWLARRIGVPAALRVGVLVAVAAYGAFTVAVAAGASLGFVAAALFFGVASYGVVVPSATAAAMDHFPSQAGSASAVLGTLQSTCGALASAAVSAFADGTARPLAAVTLTCAVIAAALVRHQDLSL
jgi:DHA1 family bicyclomycin/chloramphenicol resistance-like MFS transporter